MLTGRRTKEELVRRGCCEYTPSIPSQHRALSDTPLTTLPLQLCNGKRRGFGGILGVILLWVGTPQKRRHRCGTTTTPTGPEHLHQSSNTIAYGRWSRSPAAHAHISPFGLYDSQERPTQDPAALLRSSYKPSHRTHYRMRSSYIGILTHVIAIKKVHGTWWELDSLNHQRIRISLTARLGVYTYTHRERCYCFQRCRPYPRTARFCRGDRSLWASRAGCVAGRFCTAFDTVRSAEGTQIGRGRGTAR